MPFQREHRRRPRRRTAVRRYRPTTGRIALIAAVSGVKRGSPAKGESHEQTPGTASRRRTASTMAAWSPRSRPSESTSTTAPWARPESAALARKACKRRTDARAAIPIADEMEVAASACSLVLQSQGLGEAREARAEREGFGVARPRASTHRRCEIGCRCAPSSIPDTSINSTIRRGAERRSAAQRHHDRRHCGRLRARCGVYRSDSPRRARMRR